jgi:hypothetical protein
LAGKEHSKAVLLRIEREDRRDLLEAAPNLTIGPKYSGKAAWTRAWDELAKSQIDAAEDLGWSKGTWDFDIPPPSNLKKWAALTKSQKDSAKLFGWDVESWEKGDKTKFKGPALKWSMPWANLTSNESRAATTLGWDQEMWDGRVPPLGYSDSWGALSPDNKAAIEVFAWSPVSWNKKPSMSPLCMAVNPRGVSAAWTEPFQTLSPPRAAAAKILGWDEVMWDSSMSRPYNKSKFPDSNFKHWEELAPREKASAVMFCWNATTWMASDPHKEKGPPPLPPCNWTYDGEGVARPATCFALPNTNISCERSINKSFDGCNVTWEVLCEAPAVSTCPNPITKLLPYELGALDGKRYAFAQAMQDDIPHGQEFDLICSENATAVDHRYFLESWGQDWYPGTKIERAVCNNGTLLYMAPTNMTFFPGHPFYKPPGTKPEALRCVLKERVKLHQDLISYLRWDEPRQHEAETKGYKWIDVDAITRMTNLKMAMNESAHVEKNARNLGKLATIPDLKRLIKALIDHRMIPRGETMDQEKCKDLEKHWLYELKNYDIFKKAGNIGYANYAPPLNVEKHYPQAEDLELRKPIDFTCSYTLQKSGAGRDPMSGKMSYHYRDGCFCTSRWVSGCPFRAELNPSFRTFGFEALEVKTVSTALGAATGSLCWYFTKPSHPEWGYLRSNLGYSFQAPKKNVTELKRDWLKLRKLAQSSRFKRSN